MTYQFEHSGYGTGLLSKMASNYVLLSQGDVNGIDACIHKYFSSHKALLKTSCFAVIHKLEWKYLCGLNYLYV